MDTECRVNEQRVSVLHFIYLFKVICSEIRLYILFKGGKCMQRVRPKLATMNLPLICLLKSNSLTRKPSTLPTMQ